MDISLNESSITILQVAVKCEEECVSRPSVLPSRGYDKLAPRNEAEQISDSVAAKVQEELEGPVVLCLAATLDQEVQEQPGAMKEQELSSAVRDAEVDMCTVFINTQVFLLHFLAVSSGPRVSTLLILFHCKACSY